MAEKRSTQLRNKAIGIMYLIFLSFIFLLIPSDFVDSTYESGLAFEETYSDVSELNKFQTSIYLYLLREEEETVSNLLGKAAKIDAQSKNFLQLTRRYKEMLIADRGRAENGYPKDGQREEPSNILMVIEGRGDSLFSELVAIQDLLLEWVTDENDVAELKEILPAKSEMIHSNGLQTSFVNFYFNHVPLNAALLNLTHFEAQVERAKHFVVSVLFEEAMADAEGSLDNELLGVIEAANSSASGSQEIWSELSGILNARGYDDSTLASETESALEEEQVAEVTSSDGKDAEENAIEAEEEIIENTENDFNAYIEDKPFVKMRMPSDLTFGIGDTAAFDLDWDKAEVDYVSVRVFKNDVLYRMRKVYDKGVFNFRLSELGVYEFRFETPNTSQSERLRVIQPGVGVQNASYGTLYSGMDNPLVLELPDTLTPEDYRFEVTNGKVFFKDDKVFVRTNKTGLSILKIYENDSASTPVLEKKYAVRELKDPFASLGNYWDGSTIRIEDLTKMNGLKINYDDYFTKEVISIASFEMSLVYNGHTVITKPVQVMGSVFDESAKFLLGKAKSGDVLVFKNIRAISSLGSEIQLRSVLITVE